MNIQASGGHTDVEGRALDEQVSQSAATGKGWELQIIP